MNKYNVDTDFKTTNISTIISNKMNNTSLYKEMLWSQENSEMW